MQYSANVLDTQPSSERGCLQVFTESVQNHRFGRARAPQTWHVGSGSSALQVFSSNFSVTFSPQGLPCTPVTGCLQALPLVHCRRWMLPWHSYTFEAAKPARCKHRHRSGSERVSDAHLQSAVRDGKALCRRMGGRSGRSFDEREAYLEHAVDVARPAEMAIVALRRR